MKVQEYRSDRSYSPPIMNKSDNGEWMRSEDVLEAVRSHNAKVKEQLDEAIEDLNFSRARNELDENLWASGIAQVEKALELLKEVNK